MNPVLFSFTLKHGLILCPVVLYHQGESIIAHQMAVDTGASYSIIHPDLVYELDIDHTDSALVPITTAGGGVAYPKIEIQQMGTHQANVRDVEVLVGALPKELGIDGILGYSFLKHFVMTVNYPKQELTLERVAAA